MARKRREPEEHDNAERWMVSWADLMTLLFAVFVVMFAVSRVDNARLIKVAQSIRFALHFEGTGGVGELPIFDGPASDGGTLLDAGGAGAGITDREAAVEGLRRRLERRLEGLLSRHESASAVLLVPEGQRLTVRMTASAFFDPSQTALRPEALPVIDAIAQELLALERPLRVEGHTDAEPVRNDRFRNNWDLSAMRAATVVGYLEAAHRADPRLLAATGRGSGHPIAPNQTAEGRERNRRIELVVELGLRDPAGEAAH